MTQNELLSKLNTVKNELHGKFGVNKIGLFGSYAKDEATETSDVDLIIDMETKNYFSLIKVEHYLSHYLSKKVDIGFFDSLKPYIKNEITKDLIYV